MEGGLVDDLGKNHCSLVNTCGVSVPSCAGEEVSVDVDWFNLEGPAVGVAGGPEDWVAFEAGVDVEVVWLGVGV